MKFTCRIGLHDWSMWVGGRYTEHFDADFPGQYPYMITRAYHRHCESCGWEQTKSRKA